MMGRMRSNADSQLGGGELIRGNREHPSPLSGKTL
jgi:hypothetical protein